MSKREEFITVINTLKALSSTITSEQRKGLLQQAVQQYNLSTDEADKILKGSGLIVGEKINYFEVLGFSLEELQNQSEKTIVPQVDAAHKKQYNESLRAGGLPRSDGRTQEQWRTVLNQARDTLKDPEKRAEHIMLQIEISQHVDPVPQEEIPTPESEELPISEETSLSISVTKDMELIPAGEFQMGSEKEKANDREKPAHTVYVDAFYMDKYPVTNAQYKMFLEANPRWRKPSKWNESDKAKKKIISTLFIYRKYHDRDYLKHWDGNDFPMGKDDHPVTHVSWYAAMAYAKWIGKRLPTEAEWEKAARGGLTGQKYPWGNLMDSNMVFCGKEVDETTSVGKYPSNNYGLHDMVGNVWEWCLDEYDANFYSTSPIRNPVAIVGTKDDLDFPNFNFREIRTDRVLRGGPLFTSSEPIHTAARWGGTPALTSFLVSYSTRLADFFSPRLMANIGFRCAWDVRLKSKSI